MQAEMIQHPVGQGGLFSGKLDCGGQPFLWVYDCGSNQLEPLQREVAKLAVAPINVLFLSHLDSDHVSGIDRLLATTKVSEVVLPFLTEIERALAIAGDIEAGSLNGVFLEFAADPARWLINRGVETVTYVEGREDDSPLGDGPDGPLEGGGGGEGTISYRWSREPQHIRKIDRALVQRMDTAGVVQLINGATHKLDWVLVPYAHKPSQARLTRFRSAFRAKYPGRVTMKKIVAEASTVAGRNSLRDCYDCLWSNHNLVSMSLFAGPEHTQTRDGIFLYHRPRRWPKPFERNAIGWLATGDSYLASRMRRRAFLSHYDRFLPRVGAFVVPHHGAATYFHPDLVSSLPNLEVGVAAAGRNGYGHPHKGVRDAFENRCTFLRVSENPASMLRILAKL